MAQKAARIARLAITFIATSALSHTVFARDEIRIVGSSTVYPFTTAVAEQIGKGGAKTPVVESTGTGGGMKLFCEGIGPQTPDATNASRRIKPTEFELCAKNGVKDIFELMIGYDGLVLALSKKAAPLALTRGQIFLALAKNVPGADGKLIPNPYKSWKQIDPALPDRVIEIMGPPPTSGTRDSLHELIMEAGAEQIPAMKALKAQDSKAFEKAWKTLREDGAYIEAGENDNLIVQKLDANPNALGIFGFSFLEENAARLQGARIDGVAPEFETIAALKYTPSREMFVYVKKGHLGLIPALDLFMKEYVSEKAAGNGGYLERKGLVPPTADQLKAARQGIASGRVLRVEDLIK